MTTKPKKKGGRTRGDWRQNANAPHYNTSITDQRLQIPLLQVRALAPPPSECSAGKETRREGLSVVDDQRDTNWCPPDGNMITTQSHSLQRSPSLPP
jgi:hypothetical protein